MRFFFRRPSAAASTEVLPPPAEEPREEVPARLSFTPEAEMVEASKLPSAATALAELFPDDLASEQAAHDDSSLYPTDAESRDVDHGAAPLETIEEAASQPAATYAKIFSAPETPTAKPSQPEPEQMRPVEPAVVALSEPEPMATNAAVLSHDDIGLAPEDAATVVAAVSAELAAEEAAAEQASSQHGGTAPSPLPPAITLPPWLP